MSQAKLSKNYFYDQRRDGVSQVLYADATDD